MTYEVTKEDVGVDTLDFKGKFPESWLCIDCGFNTGPGLLNREQMEKAARELGEAWHKGASVRQEFTSDSEVYTVRSHVWAEAGVDPMGGCLCIGCLEKRIGRRLKPIDFPRGHAFNGDDRPGTPRLVSRRGTARDAIAAYRKWLKAGHQ
jgi:hypothetical protein